MTTQSRWRGRIWHVILFICGVGIGVAAVLAAIAYKQAITFQPSPEITFEHGVIEKIKLPRGSIISYLVTSIQHVSAQLDNGREVSIMVARPGSVLWKRIEKDKDISKEMEKKGFIIMNSERNEVKYKKYIKPGDGFFAFAEKEMIAIIGEGKWSDNEINEILDEIDIRKSKQTDSEPTTNNSN